MTDIYIVGTGIVGNRQMTREAEDAVKHSDRVYTVVHQSLIFDRLERLCDDVISLLDEYENEGQRSGTYRRMADRVIEGAKETEGPVTFALYGHPMVGVSPSHMVVDEAPEHDLTIDIRPGVSSMDCIYCDLELDPCGGIQMFEATDLLLREYELNPDIPTMIWQIGSVETALLGSGESRPERFVRTREYLEQYYPDDHVVKLIQTAEYPFIDSEVIEVELGEFESVHDRINGFQTLYIPRVSSRSVENEELLELIESKDHLETIIKPADD